MNVTSKFGLSQSLEVDKIDSSQFQVRINYGNIDELAANIKRLGLMEPILVRPYDSRYEVVHGHRRVSAVKKNGQKTIRAFVKELTDLEAIELQGSENIQRKDYDPIEEARLYSNYKRIYDETTGKRLVTRDLGKKFAKSADHVRERMLLLELPQETQEKIADKKLSVSKARQLSKITESADAVGKITEAASEDEKGDSYLKTEKGVAKAISLLKEGISVDDAIKEAKTDEVIAEVSKMQQRGVSPNDIISKIMSTQLDPEEILRDTQLTTLRAVEDDFMKKGIVCPECGEICLEWHCTNTKLMEDVC